MEDKYIPLLPTATGGNVFRSVSHSFHGVGSLHDMKGTACERGSASKGDGVCLSLLGTDI